VGEERPVLFGELLRDLRLAAGLSQETLAERAHMSSDGISALERGISRGPQRETLTLIQDGLQLSPSDRAKLESAAVRPQYPRRRARTRDETLADNLPNELTSFVGRAAQVDEISAILNKGRLVTIVGPGGVGKTRIALQVARNEHDANGVGVCITDLSLINAASGSTTRSIAQALGIEGVPNQLPLKGIIAYLERKSVLLIIDNCEHVLPDVGNDIRDILQGCSDVRILATSREPLRIPGERIYRLQPLSNEDAIKLFVERAEVADHRFVLTDERAPLVARLCERLDGIPLAIELAAARMGALPLKALVERLDQRFSILTGVDQKALPRQRTMRALIDWSYDLLEPREQMIFEQLSVFAGGCTLELAASVCRQASIQEADVLDVLASLVDKSLVVAELDDEQPRYFLLETIREYARGKLQERGAWHAVAHRHALAYYALAERIENATDTTAMTFPSLRPAEIENWRAALEFTLASSGDVELGLRLSGVLRLVWSRYAPNEGRYWLNAALARVSEATPLDVLAQLEYARANVALRFVESHLALDLAQRALDHYRELDDVSGIVRTQRLLGYVLLTVGRVAQAEPLLNTALTTARELGYRWLEAFALENLAFADSLAGRSDKVQASYAEAIAAYEAVGDERGAATAALNLAEAKFRAGDAAAALHLSEGAVDSLQNVGYAEVPALANLASYLIGLGRFEEARVRALEAVELGRELQQHVPLSWSLQHVAAIDAFGPQRSRDYSRESGLLAARLLGFVDKRLESLGAPRQDIEEREYRTTLEALEATLGVNEMREQMLTGATLSEEQAIALSERSNGKSLTGGAA
jgi:predicted ATPase/DNA-binding XRE family transcriptional regulator